MNAESKAMISIFSLLSLSGNCSLDDRYRKKMRLKPHDPNTSSKYMLYDSKCSCKGIRRIIFWISIHPGTICSDFAMKVQLQRHQPQGCTIIHLPFPRGFVPHKMSDPTHRTDRSLLLDMSRNSLLTLLQTRGGGSAGYAGIPRGEQSPRSGASAWHGRSRAVRDTPHLCRPP